MTSAPGSLGGRLRSLSRIATSVGVICLAVVVLDHVRERHAMERCLTAGEWFDTATGTCVSLSGPVPINVSPCRLGDPHFELMVGLALAGFTFAAIGVLAAGVSRVKLR